MGAQHTDSDTYTYTAARAVEASDLTLNKSRASAIAPAKMPRPSLVFSLLTLGSLLLLPTTIDASPVFVDNPSLAQFQSGRNIRHLPCIVRKSGRSGVCMFAIDCIKQNGTHLGTCIDRFYFGSCCAMKEEASLFAPEINDNSIDQNTISHFAHESTTLPTSALFKLTTESSLSSSSSTHQHATNELLRNVTQSYLSTAKPAPVRPASNSSLSSTRRPPLAHSTHKNSHFVVRTTVKPSVVQTTTTLTPTIKPPRRRTTTAKPVLTTAPIVVEQRIETTTVPTKFVTFQIVETTTPSVTEPTHLQETTTATSTRRHTRPTGSSSSVASRTTSKTTTTSTSTTPTPTTTTTTEAPATTTSTKAPVTTQRPTPPLRTTTPTKPHKTHSSRRPAPAKKPASSTTTTASGSQSTRKPADSLASSSTTANATTATTLPARRPVIQASSSSSTSTTTNVFKDELIKNGTTTRLPERTTQAPRPKPKPTGEIVKVPALLAEPATTTGTTATSSSSGPSKSPASATTPVVSKKKPSTTSAAPTTSTTTTTPKPTRRSTTKAPTTTTTTTKATTTTTKATTTTTSTTTTTTTTAKPLLTTEAPTTAPLTTTTKKTGLITWTDVEAEPPTNASISNDWQPAPPSNWLPLATQTPEAATQTLATTAPPSATDKVVISVATSVSEVETHGPGKPHRTTKPPKPSSTAKPATTTTTAATSTEKTTEAPPSSIELVSSTSSYTDISSEVAASSSSSSSTTSTTTSSPTSTAETTDYSGEEPNTTTIEATGSTTVAPANALEGVDYKEVCGRRMFPEPRIVGGANAAFGRWPWQISLRQWRTSTYLHKCGAALLNENWAITAAHCVDNVPPSDLLLRLGEYDLAEEEEPYGYQERRVQIVASHPQFDPRTFEYDLALLRFYEPVVFQPNIIPVCVPDNDENFIGQTAFVTGWGRLYEDGPLPSVLQEVAVPVINNTICESMYRSAGYIEHIPHIFICAGWKKGGYDSCEGDSGGPMVLQRETDKRFQLGGVISWGIGCAEANQPGVYTRISEFRDWINQILQF
ncbi:serine proteinase stubble isoform X1 [Drosophila gunungcola]|uniref:serine proteinase stubble isoform X1 n=2 Tax=Drosophila gunungcola TaxID=103775 RepID=UPI0022E342ED|nr:serine proteinase stubble isoform X1 [Drosophila gunungcola]XP_052843444.1 serine proteinase stubble isoform X1 [Drosophila gunungcola]XP_052843445.1 serine proteinase stubble isoform X1 [Drosophila gunungcola]XP_052843446.1 serine proteinase stubble isoform X1 [Drosophila gunungcola]XP_052843447.1 serine proteinase stubble isoform X1 [Drosophila gunungcola]XP_052843448.1 serine proteinase stubble isoform X1 [Drosophila gunungcola]XP_052843449.1 serine proteinase stubble isoform X1 [Drosop